MFPANWGMDYATYHLLWEPKTTIDQIIGSTKRTTFLEYQAPFFDMPKGGNHPITPCDFFLRPESDEGTPCLKDADFLLEI